MKQDKARCPICKGGDKEAKQLESIVNCARKKHTMIESQIVDCR